MDADADVETGMTTIALHVLRIGELKLSYGEVHKISCGGVYADADVETGMTTIALPVLRIGELKLSNGEVHKISCGGVYNVNHWAMNIAFCMFTFWQTS